MYQGLFNHINRYSAIGLSVGDKSLIEQLWSFKKLRRREYLLQAGETCRNACFINKGALSQYLIDEKGDQNVVQFAIEKWWITDRESYFNQTPSRYFIESYEESEVLLLPFVNLKAFQGIPAVADMFWKMSQNNHIAEQNRLVETLSLPAQDRYVNFLEKYPELVDRFPQYLIASYLGVSKETLSRIINDQKR